MTWQILAAITPATGLLGIAVWRFARLEGQVKHQARCQRLIIKALIRLKREIRKQNN